MYEEGERTLFHLINISPMPQIGAASGCEAQGDMWTEFREESSEYRVRSRDGDWGMGPNGRWTRRRARKTQRAALF